MGAGARVISDPNSKVLELKGSLLKNLYPIRVLFRSSSIVIKSFTKAESDSSYLIQRHDLSSTLLNLPQLLQEIPETRLGNNLVVGEETHTVEFWSGVRLRRKTAANDYVLMKATWGWFVSTASCNKEGFTS